MKARAAAGQQTLIRANVAPYFKHCANFIENDSIPESQLISADFKKKPLTSSRAIFSKKLGAGRLNQIRIAFVPHEGTCALTALAAERTAEPILDFALSRMTSRGWKVDGERRHGQPKLHSIEQTMSKGGQTITVRGGYYDFTQTVVVKK